MYLLKDKNFKKGKLVEMTRTNLKNLELKESDLEELIRNNVELLIDDNESLLIIGQQVKNEQLGRSDLVAIDGDGNIVLIEIKRDKEDAVYRKEPFEFQAIRYAASFASIESKEEILETIFIPYIEKRKHEIDLGQLTVSEFARRQLKVFIEENKIKEDLINEHQRIILVASGFDKQTLSAVAWLNKYEVQIACYQIVPYDLGDQLVIQRQTILPVPDYKSYYVNLLQSNVHVTERKQRMTRTQLPKIDELIENSVVNPGDIIIAKGRKDEAELLSNGNVLINGEEMSMQVWLKNLYGWSSVQTYLFAIQKKSRKTLSQLREEYMNKNRDNFSE